MTLKNIISIFVSAYKELKLKGRAREAKKLKEKIEKIEIEKKKLEDARKVIFNNELLVSKQTADIIIRIFKIYPTDKVDKVIFSTDNPEYGRILNNLKERTITICLNNLVPHFRRDEDLYDPWDNTQQISVRGMFYSDLFRSLIECIYDIENPKVQKDCGDHEKMKLSKQYSNGCSKKDKIEEMLQKEFRKRRRERKLLSREKEKIVQKTLLLLFTGHGAVEPPLIVKEPYLAQMVYKKLIKGVDSELTWAFNKLNWPDTCVIYEDKCSKGTIEIIYSMASYYVYQFAPPNKGHWPKPLDQNEVKRRKEFWENRLYDDEYYQLIDKFETEMDSLNRLISYSLPPKRKGLLHVSRCWRCGATINSDFCEEDFGYGYKCNKCGNSLRNKF